MIFKKIRGFFRNIVNGITNLIKWTPVIWQDRDWDQWYLYSVMHKKLLLMEKFHNSNHTWSSTAKSTAKQIRLCRILCKRLMDNAYIINATMFPYDKLYNDDDYFTFEPVPGTNYSRLVETETPEQKKMFKKACKHSEYMQKQDRELLFKTMSKYIDGWWD